MLAAGRGGIMLRTTTLETLTTLAPREAYVQQTGVTHIRVT